MSEIVFTSALRPTHKDELERLLFFNANQARVSASVSLIAERYGVPRIQVVEDHLRIELDSPVEAQTLYAVQRTASSVEPVGVVVYTREEDAFVVLFVAVHEDFTARGPLADRRLLMRITDELRAIARRVRGVRSLVMFMGRPAPLRLSVDRGPR